MAAPAHAWMPLSAFTDRRLGARDMRVLGALYAHADTERTCWPSVSTLAALTGIDRRDVQRTIRRLEGFGWLTVEAGGGRAATSRYRLWQASQTAGDPPADIQRRAGKAPAVDDEKAGISPAVDSPQRAGESPQKGGCFTPETAGELPARTYQEQTRNINPLFCATDMSASEPKAKCGEAAREASFADFWRAYPKRRGKADARKAWMKLAPDEGLTERILQAVAQARASPDWRKEGGQFIPYPATWLRRRGWEDELETDIVPLPDSRGSRYGESQRIGGTLAALDSMFRGEQEHAQHDVPEGHGLPVSRVWH
ncbi:helix-turn-helix domain-containing protein [Halomonas sp. HL-93]|uniref:helix-turn-helix domain-containing protein n=1 Tax=Halomonas sp. HL-93 TaxID=1666906 RepID=UPI0006DBAF6D|nr:helix-turn-helix domain-containing protein [Halomonas sp. HL-93]KPQ19686.1 MAG: Helix-turn-helix domain [Halomonas sp. HL-93]SBR52033.1 Helix-turn-helix domain-containing protein [Halomonas sp. HL-93]